MEAHFNQSLIKNKMYLIGLLLLGTALALNVPECGSSSPPVLTFSFYNGSADPTASTTASICHTPSSLRITWHCIDKEIISPYQSCNDPLYNADAVEIFIST